MVKWGLFGTFSTCHRKIYYMLLYLNDYYHYYYICCNTCKLLCKLTGLSTGLFMTKYKSGMQRLKSLELMDISACIYDFSRVYFVCLFFCPQSKMLMEVKWGRRNSDGNLKRCVISIQFKCLMQSNAFCVISCKSCVAFFTIFNTSESVTLLANHIAHPPPAQFDCLRRWLWIQAAVHGQVRFCYCAIEIIFIKGVCCW